MDYESPLFVSTLDSQMNNKIEQVRDSNPGLGSRLADYYGNKAMIAFYPEMYIKSGLPEEEILSLVSKFSSFVDKILGNGIDEITSMFENDSSTLTGTELNATFVEEKMGI